VLGVANLLTGIDLDPYRHEKASFGRFNAGNFGFLTLIQSGYRPPPPPKPKPAYVRKRQTEAAA